MSVKFGFNIGTSDMKSLLEQDERQKNGVRSWKQLFGGAAQGYQAQQSALTSSFGDAIAQAYKANMAQSNAIASAGLNAGATRDLLESNRAALHNAYQTYIQNYGEQTAKNAENYLSTVGSYDAELTNRAENFSKLYNYAYKYLAEEVANSTKNGVSWLTDNDLMWLYDTETNAAMSWDKLSKDFADPITGELTTLGQEFFDAMFNARAEGYTTSEGNAMRGFDKWLSDTDANLRDWYVSGDIYNYTKAGRNLGTARTLLGLESTDDSYSYAEYVHQSDAPVLDVDSFNTTMQELVPAYQELDKLGKAYTTMRGNREALFAEASKPGSGSINAAYEYADLSAKESQAKIAFDTASEEYLKAQTDAISKMSENLTKSLSEFEKKIGEDAYKEFISRNQETYDKLQKLFKPGRYLSPESMVEIKYLLEAFNKEFAEEAKKLSQRKKKSSGV